MEKQPITTIAQSASLPLICPLCQQSIALEMLREHLLMHSRAEMMADILALSRR